MSTCATFNSTATCQGTELIIYWILNTVSLLVFAIAAIVGLAEYSNTWYDHIVTYTDSYTYAPFTPDDILMYINVSLLIILSLFILALVALKGTVVKDDVFFNTYFGSFTKFIFVPILITSGMFFIGCANHTDDRKACLWTSLIFAIINICLLIAIYATMGPNGGNWMLFIYKKCFISCLIVFNFYYFFYDISHLAWRHKLKSGEVCSEVFMVIFALIICAGVWFLNEVVSGFFAWLLYVGFVAYSAQGGDQRKNIRRTPELVISIIIMILLLGLEVIVVLLKKAEVMN